jgi:UPF0755 protein
MKEYRFIIITALIALIGIPSYFMIDLNSYLYNPAYPLDSKRTLITVAQGDNFSKVTDNLYAHRLIIYPFKFKVAARLKGFDRKFIAGEYEFSGSMPPIRILESLENGEIFLHRLTVPEGFTICQIAEKLEQSGICNKDDFIATALNPEFTAQMDIPAQTVEGYLFPDTYFFSKGSAPEHIIISMVNHFRKKFGPAWEERSKTLGLSVHEIVTLASIIEKETGQEAERPVIASVFHNRLKKNIRLESDPTVIYGMKNFNGDITKQDLKEKTPYNTYVIPGLPPGPIASPGVHSIRAALFPDNTNYLFFVSRKDGTHQFSGNLKEHQKAVRQFQLAPPPVPPSAPPSEISEVPATQASESSIEDSCVPTSGTKTPASDTAAPEKSDTPVSP